jgi:branched-subunit amino acid aminotransferase/4-amino-4-deoxychorismate lyase
MDVWINGRFVPRDEALVSVFDAGFQHAVGLFETVAARNGRIFRGGDHMRRLVGSAQEMTLTERLHAEPLVEAMERTVARNGLEQARVRITVTGGDLNPLQAHGRTVVDPTIVVVAQPPTIYPEQFFGDGVAVTIADERANPLDAAAGHKTLDYWARIRALQAAAVRRAGEAIWLSVTNHLASGSVSNLLLVREGRLLTPIARGEEEAGALRVPVLPGITRACLLELADAEGLEVERRMLDIDDLLGADELMLTNSSWGVLPVVRVEREEIGAGRPGPVTTRLREAYEALVDRETGS